MEEMGRSQPKRKEPVLSKVVGDLPLDIDGKFKFKPIESFEEE